jgi:hypothetical protein
VTLVADVPLSAATVVLGVKSAMPMGRIVPFTEPVMWPPRMGLDETVPSVVDSLEMVTNEVYEHREVSASV